MLARADNLVGVLVVVMNACKTKRSGAPVLTGALARCELILRQRVDKHTLLLDACMQAVPA